MKGKDLHSDFSKFIKDTTKGAESIKDRGETKSSFIPRFETEVENGVPSLLLTF